jgi:hypothetical protein
MKPQTLYEIWWDIIKDNTSTFYPTFRVRNTEQIVDYLICNHKQWEIPKIMCGLMLEPPTFNVYLPLDGKESIYSMLSTPEEIEYLTGLNDDKIPEVMQLSYMNF